MSESTLQGKPEFIEMFEKAGALLKGHFELSSGLHSDRYLQCALVLQYPAYAQAFCAELASKFRSEEIDGVIGPALGGVIVSYETARALAVPSLFSERKDGKMVLRRGFDIRPGQRLLIVEDVVTTGGSILEVARLVQQREGIIAGFGMIVNRMEKDIEFPARVESVICAQVKTYDPGDCPLCGRGLGIDKPGSRR